MSWNGTTSIKFSDHIKTDLILKQVKCIDIYPGEEAEVTKYWTNVATKRVK